MANLTIWEFQVLPNSLGEVTWPADTVTTIDTGSVTSHSLGSGTRVVIITSDADVRMRINGTGVSTAATASAIPVLSAAPNQFGVAAASGQTLKFA